MNRLFTVLGLAFLGLTAANCNKDDGNGGNQVVNLRDRKEVREENAKQIEHFIDNNYLIEKNGIISFDSITSKDYQGQPTLRKDPRLTSAKITSDNYEYESYRLSNGNTSLKFSKPKDTLSYKVYYLILSNKNDNVISTNKKNENAPISTTDSVFVKTKAFSLKNESYSPYTKEGNIGSYYSFPLTLKEFGYMSQGQYLLIPDQLKTGERQILTKVKTATNIKLKPDGTYGYDEGSAGRIIAIIPSGIGYFNAGYSNIVKAYQPHIIDMTLITKKERDHDGDGIPSKYEVEAVMKLGREVSDQELLDMKLTIHDYFAYDTDGDGIPNFLDDDDDGDGVLTKTELQYKDKKKDTKYRTLKYYDPLLINCNTGTYRFLDKTCFPDQKDGEIIWPFEKNK